MGPGVRGTRLVILFFLVFALCTVPFGESGCVFVDTEKTGQITFEAWHSECRIWTTKGDFLNCTLLNVNATIQQGDVILAKNESGGPIEPRAIVGAGNLILWSEPETASYATAQSVDDDDVATPAGESGDDGYFGTPAIPEGITEEEPISFTISCENATNVSAPVVGNETGGSRAPDQSIIGKGEVSGEAPEPPPVLEGDAGAEAFLSSVAGENATAVETIVGEGEADALIGFNESSAVRDKDLNESVFEGPSSPGADILTPHGAGACNESVGEKPLQKPSDQVFIDGNEQAAAPAAPPRVMAAKGGIWTHCALVTITNLGENILTDYQVRVNVSHQEGMLDNFSDIRFTNDKGHLLPHWHDGHAGSNPAVFWVRVPTIPPGDSTIDLHYGNGDAQDASNGTATFLFYDDFDDDTIGEIPDGWTKTGRIRAEVTGDHELSVKNTGLFNFEGGYLTVNQGEWSDVAVRERIKLSDLVGRGKITTRYVGKNNYVSAEFRKDLFSISARVMISGCIQGNEWSNGEYWDVSGVWDAWHTEELGLSGRRADLFVDGQWLGSANLPDNAPISGKTGLYVNDLTEQLRDEHIVRKYSPTFGYHTNGTITSNVFDTGANDSKWDSLAWNAITSPEINISFEVRASNASFSYNNATLPWKPVGNTSPVSTNLSSGRYLQWRANLSTTDNTRTSVLEEVRVWYTPGGY
ncbi:DUF2341 domain-containing protein [Methanofollis aquaemaris]|uniref:DUF2341 domain-containing protein n=1 Tax=Methanofollis aquaemaris TaxID=126734 RepID=A0A8A3S3X5_9EURY|nr:DUF2341 domain-containing protein [Methanofollis aquaemaris]QSZ66835.1 DUF2341 domain-containing protein [Methanofollis aquaemaris]